MSEIKVREMWGLTSNLSLWTTILCIDGQAVWCRDVDGDRLERATGDFKFWTKLREADGTPVKTPEPNEEDDLKAVRVDQVLGILRAALIKSESWTADISQSRYESRAPDGWLHCCPGGTIKYEIKIKLPYDAETVGALIDKTGKVPKEVGLEPEKGGD